MAFVHGLVKTPANGRTGWCAPVELGEASPHYVSFVIPVDEKRGYFNKYDCEIITTQGAEKRRDAHELVRRGDDSFLLRLGSLEVWFTVRPGPKEDRPLPYVGALGHEDFRYLFTEIQPEEPAMLDRLYEDQGAIVVGCEPFAHYSNIQDVGESAMALGKTASSQRAAKQA